MKQLSASAKQSEVFFGLFDRENDPSYQIGRVSDQFVATAEQISKARSKLKTRRGKWLWKTLDAATLRSLRLRKQRGSPTEENSAEGATGTPPVITLDEMLARLAQGEGQAAIKPLPFYGGAQLIHVSEAEAWGPARRVIVFPGTGKKLELNGKSPPIHALNQKTPIQLSDETVEEYVQFFCEHVHADDGPFYVTEEDREQADEFPKSLVIAARDAREGPALRRKISAWRKIGNVDREVVHHTFFPKAVIGWPLTLVGKSDESWTLLTTVIYGDEPFRAAFVVRPSGLVEMREDLTIPRASVTLIRRLWPRGWREAKALGA